jgi:hypothetical protein
VKPPPTSRSQKSARSNAVAPPPPPSSGAKNCRAIPPTWKSSRRLRTTSSRVSLPLSTTHAAPQARRPLAATARATAVCPAAPPAAPPGCRRSAAGRAGCRSGAPGRPGRSSRVGLQGVLDGLPADRPAVRRRRQELAEDAEHECVARRAGRRGVGGG